LLDLIHRGTPPAANSVIEGFPAVVICQDEIKSGAAFCAICKDVIPLGESGKKFPYQHLYHGDFLIPWLNYRNSSLMCRYELPTDDADYEDRKEQCCMLRSTTTNPGMNSPEGGLS
jgi:E3 ubiquitin-protein ligase RNF115/126